jgi:hypothetical protein
LYRAHDSNPSRIDAASCFSADERLAHPRQLSKALPCTPNGSRESINSRDQAELCSGAKVAKREGFEPILLKKPRRSF